MVAVFIVFMLGARSSVSSEEMKHWDDRLYWVDYPKNALPVWHPRADMGGSLKLSEGDEVVVSVRTLPTNLVLSNATLLIIRPDGLSIRLSGTGSVNSNVTLAAQVKAFGRELGLDEGGSIVLHEPAQILFLSGDGTLLMGDYTIRVESGGEVVLFGNAYGLLGTDGYGRDLWAGFVRATWGTIVLAGFAVLFVIVIGLPFGVMSGYYSNVIGDAAGCLWRRFTQYRQSLSSW